MRRSTTLGLTLLLSAVALAGLAIPSFVTLSPGTPPPHPATGRIVQGGSFGDTQVACPTGSSLSWGPVTLNCFQTLDLAEIGAILIGVGIAIWIYWDSDEAELPGDSREVPVTSEEEYEFAQRRKREALP